MSQNTYICQICLCTDRKLKLIDIRLAEFHDELCDFSLQTMDPQYCLDCEHLLRKLYNFKAKCVMAYKLLHKWKKTKAADKMPLNILYTLLPKTSLGHCNPGNSMVYSYSYQSDPGSISSVNLLQIDPTFSINVNNSQPHIVLVPIESIFDDTQQDISNQEFQEHTPPDEDIKLEINCESDLKDLITLKTEDATKTIEEIILKNDGSFLHAEVIEDVKLQNEDIDNVEDVSSSDSDNDKDDNLRQRQNSSNKRCRKKVKLKYNSRCDPSFTELDNIPLSYNVFDDSMKESARKKKIVKENKTKRKIIDQDDSEKQRRVVKNRSFDKDDSRKKQRVTKDRSIDKDDGRKKQRVTKDRSIDKDDVRKQRRVTKNKLISKDDKKKERFHTKKDILAELASIVNSDAVDENCENVKGGKLLFSKERLKAELTAKFALCGELTADDGTVVDKQFIVNCLDDKVTEFVMRQLWNAVHGKSALKPKALKLFKCIQNKYKNEYESVFDIEYLNTKEKMLEEFQRRKTYECYISAEFKCEKCFQGFKHEKKLEYHKKCHDVSTGEFVCSICSVRQKHKKNLISHVNSHEAVYKCKLCPLVTYYKCSMVNHYQLHKGVKFRCEPCDTTFGSQSAYRTHVSYRHQRRHVCTTCGRAFFTEIGLKWHGTRAHQNEAPPTEQSAPARCPQCPLVFPTHEACLRHVRITHEAVARGRPPGSTTTHSTQQSPRMCRPRKKPVITCRVCNAVGSSIGWLNLHFRIEHPSADMAVVYADKQTHLCDVCGKGFTTIYTLRAHLSTHTGARPFACGSCPARFARALSLRAHRAAHAPPSRGCSYCGKKFRSQSNLTNHVRFHIGDRRYKCKICGKGFLHRGTLNEHVRGVHHNVRRVRKRGVAEAGIKGVTEACGGGVTEACGGGHTETGMSVINE